MGVTRYKKGVCVGVDVDKDDSRIARCVFCTGCEISASDDLQTQNSDGVLARRWREVVPATATTTRDPCGKLCCGSECPSDLLCFLRHVWHDHAGLRRRCGCGVSE